VQPSRFALLKVEDDDDSDQDNKKLKGTKLQQNGAAKKKKNKKKKGGAAEDAQLRNLAFGSGKPLNRPQPPKKSEATEEQWKQWQKLDKELTEDSYEKDLQQAILQSKLEAEETKQVHGAIESNDDGKKGPGKDKKKKKKDKNAMTLDEFNKLEINDKLQESDEELIEVMPSKPKLNTTVSTPETEFFNKVDQEVTRSIRKEKIQEEYKKQYSMESGIVSKYKAELEEKDREIQVLKVENTKLTDDCKEVKKRNKQLCVILSQGEMKDKKAVLVEVEQLKSIRDELTAEVGSLTSDLEKERSTVRSLREEIAKLKGNRQGGR